eukprot:15376612-Alexandrium_andersonii.AAC.1
MASTLIVPGILHIVHNLLGDLHQRLQWRDCFWEHLKAIEGLLCDQHYRERFMATCLLPSTFELAASDFRSFSGR